MSEQETSVAGRWRDPWIRTCPGIEGDEIFPDIPSLEWTIIDHAERNLRGVDPELDQILDETAAQSLWETSDQFKPGERLAAALSELSGQSENPAIQTALTVYAVQIMEAQRDYLRKGGIREWAGLFPHVTPIVEGLVVKNPKLAPEADTLNKVADCAKEYASLAWETEAVDSKRAAEECWIAYNTLWGILLETPALPEELQLTLAGKANDRLLLALCLRSDLCAEAAEAIKSRLKTDAS